MRQDDHKPSPLIDLAQVRDWADLGTLVRLASSQLVSDHVPRTDARSVAKATRTPRLVGGNAQ